MPYKMIVLVKQVPDTQNITSQAMKDDGTVNRSALPAIFNPEDLNALEMALAVRDQYGGRVTVMTMGPPAAAEVLRDSLMRGADDVVLLTDIKFAGADTLATSYALAQGVLTHSPDYDIIFCGRQAIDGDTAQIGPQVAGKLDIPQITYVETINKLEDGKIEVRRDMEGGYEVTESTLPVLLTVPGTANEPRPRRAKLLMQYKKALTGGELTRQLKSRDLADGELERARAEEMKTLESRGLRLPEWNVEAIDADPEGCGFAGSPTRVMQIESVVLTSAEHKSIEPTKEGIAALVHELIEDHVLE